MIKPAKIFLYSVPFLLLAGYFLFSSMHSPLSDWAGYYFGSRELLNGNYQVAYDPASLNLLIAREGYRGEFVSYTPFPPFTAIVVAPFLVFSAHVSKIIFTIFSMLFFLIALHRAFKFFLIPNWFSVLIPIIFFFPFRNNIFLGQGYFLVTALLIEGYTAHREGRRWISSFCWAVAIVFKIFPVLIVLFLLFKKKYKEAIYVLSMGLALLLLSIIFVGLPAWKLYLLDIFPRLNNGEFNDPFSAVFQSAFILFKDLFVYDAVLNPRGLGRPYLFLALVLLFKSFTIAACIHLTRHDNRNDLLTFASWIVASILISPNGSNYSLILLTIPFLWIAASIQDMPQHRPKLIAAAILLSLIANVPVHYFQQLPIMFRFPRLYLMIVFFTLLFSLADVAIRLKTLAAVLICFTLIALPSIFVREETSKYLMSKEEHILVYDYSVKDNKLVYYYWDDKGSHEVISDFTVRGISFAGLELRHKQIYFEGRKMTLSNANKKKPALLNGSTIIYLSDEGRGVGFFSIRQIGL